MKATLTLNFQFNRIQAFRPTFSNVPRSTHCKICDRILFEQALLTAIDKSNKYNRDQLHRQTPRRNLKATAGCVAHPPCCKDAQAVGYFKSETLRVKRYM